MKAPEVVVITGASVGVGRAVVLPIDVGAARQLESAAQTVEENFGPIDIWVNNAMVSVFRQSNQ